MELRIQHTWPQVGIDTTQGQLSIEQKPAQMEITSKPAQLQGGGEAFRVEINQYPCWAEVGLKNSTDLLREFAQRGHADALEGIGRRAAEGDQLASIETKVDAIVAIATNVLLPPPDEFNIALMPTSRPEINFVGGKKLTIEPIPVDIKVTPQGAKIDFNPGKVDIYLKQKPEFSFEFVGDNIDSYG